MVALKIEWWTKSKECLLNTFKYHLTTSKHKQYLFNGQKADAHRSAVTYSESSARNWWCCLLEPKCIATSTSPTAI